MPNDIAVNDRLVNPINGCKFNPDQSEADRCNNGAQGVSHWHVIGLKDRRAAFNKLYEQYSLSTLTEDDAELEKLKRELQAEMDSMMHDLAQIRDQSSRIRELRAEVRNWKCAALSAAALFAIALLRIWGAL